MLSTTSIGQNPFTETIYFRKYSVTRGFWVKIPVYESCAAGAMWGDFGRFRAIVGFSGLCTNTPFPRFFQPFKILLQSLFPGNGFRPILVASHSH